MMFFALFVLVCLSFAVPHEYRLLKKFMETKDVGTALFLLDNYPGAVFSQELKIELAKVLLERGERKRARELLRSVRLERVGDEYGELVVFLWRETGLDPKPVVLRFPELSIPLIGSVSLSREEEEKVLGRLLGKRMYPEVLEISKNCYFRGAALYKLGRYEEALRELSVCGDERGELFLLLTYLKLGDTKSAESFAKKRDKRELYFKLARAFFHRGELSKAKRYFLYSGESFRSYFYIGLIEFIEKKYRLAYESFSQAEKLARGNVERGRALFWKFKTLRELGQEDLALYYLKESSKTVGFYSVVAKKLLGEKAHESVNLSFPLSPSPLADRLIGIRRLGFYRYARLEAFERAQEFTPSDILKLLEVDPHISIRVAARVFGMNSDIYRAVSFPLPFRTKVFEAAGRFGIDPALLYAVMKQESLFDERALSRAGAKGLMQLMDETALWIARKTGLEVSSVYDPDTNISLGAAYLRYLLDLWKGDLVKAIASYNAGQGNVRRWRDYEDKYLFIESIPFDETRRYVRRVLWFYYIYSELLR